jgi:hypothetical protein
MTKEIYVIEYKVNITHREPNGDLVYNEEDKKSIEEVKYELEGISEITNISKKIGTFNDVQIKIAKDDKAKKFLLRKIISSQSINKINK